METLEPLYAIGANVKSYSFWENSKNFHPLQIKNRTAIWSNNLNSGYIPKSIEIRISKRPCPTFIAVSFTIAKICSHFLAGALDLYLLSGSCSVGQLFLRDSEAQDLCLSSRITTDSER